MWRMLACTVGTRGLFGWKISDSPAARNSSPSPGTSLAISGRSVPCTSEKPTPAVSNSAPSASTRVRPPPPPGRDQPSSRKRPPPSTASMALVMRSCRSRKYGPARSARGSTSVSYPAGGLERHDPFLDVAEARIALADVLEEIERLPDVTELLEHGAQQVVELDRLLGGRLRQVQRLLVPLDRLAELALGLDALADHRVGEDRPGLVGGQLLELVDRRVVEPHLLVGDPQIAVRGGIGVLRRRELGDGPRGGRDRPAARDGARPLGGEGAPPLGQERVPREPLLEIDQHGAGLVVQGLLGEEVELLELGRQVLVARAPLGHRRRGGPPQELGRLRAGRVQ